MIFYQEGNILGAKENIICQSVNHQGVMGSGLAKQIKQEYPEIMHSYSNMCKVLSFESIRRNGMVCWHDFAEDKWIASIFGQDKYGTDKRYTDYISLGMGLESVRLFAKDKNYSVAIPYKIGCGLGGGDWKIVLSIIYDTFAFSPELDVSIYKYS